MAIARLQLVNRDFKDAHAELDLLLGRLAEPEDNAPGQTREQRDATILASLPGIGRIVCAPNYILSNASSMGHDGTIYSVLREFEEGGYLTSWAKWCPYCPHCGEADEARISKMHRE